MCLLNYIWQLFCLFLIFFCQNLVLGHSSDSSFCVPVCMFTLSRSGGEGALARKRTLLKQTSEESRVGLGRRVRGMLWVTDPAPFVNSWFLGVYGSWWVCVCVCVCVCTCVRVSRGACDLCADVCLCVHVSVCACVSAWAQAQNQRQWGNRGRIGFFEIIFFFNSSCFLAPVSEKRSALCTNYMLCCANQLLWKKKGI